MKWCRFEAGGRVAYGFVEGETVVEVAGSPFDSYKKTSKTYPLGSVKLEIPVIPRTFYAAGVNYPEHVTWAAKKVGTQPNLPKRADVGYRAVNALILHQAPFALPIFHQSVKFYPMAAAFNRRLGDPVVQLAGYRARPLRLSPPRVQGGPPRS